MTMATVTYKRRMFPGQLLIVRPMAASKAALGLIETVKSIKKQGASGSIRKTFFFLTDIFLPSHFFRKINSHLGTIIKQNTR